MRNGNLIESNKLNNKNNKNRYENKKSKISKKMNILVFQKVINFLNSK